MPKSSEDYWREREEEQRKHNIEAESEYEKEIAKIYKRMLNEIETQINAFFTKYAKQNAITMAEAKKRANKLDIEAYAEKAKKYVKEKNFSEQANKEMKIYNLTMKANRLELLKAQLGLEFCAGADEIQMYMEEKLEGRTLDEIERQAGILGKSVQNNKEFAKSIVNASFHNATFSDRIWAQQDNLRNELSNILTNALIGGRNPREFIPQIRKRFNVTQGQADRLLRTELARVQTDAQMKSFGRNGFDEYTFLALGTACEVCRKLDGKHFEVDKANAGVNMPPMHPNCRCSTSAYMDDEEYEAWINSYKDHGLTWDEWKKQEMGNQEYRPLDKGNKESFVAYRARGLTNITASRLNSYSNPVYLSDKAKVSRRDVHNIHKNTLDAYKTYQFKHLKVPKIVIVDQTELTGAFGLYDCVTNTVYYSSDVADRKGMTSYGGAGITEFHEMWHAKQADNFKGKGWEITESNRKEYIQQLRKDCKRRIDKLGITTDNVGEISEYADRMYDFVYWDEVEAEYYAVHRKG